MSSTSPATSARLEQPETPAAAPRAGWLGWSAAVAVIVSILVMIGVSLLRASWMPPKLPLPATGPPWQLAARVPARPVIAALWPAILLAGAGVAAGLAAIRRGNSVPVRTLWIAAVLGVLALTALPPVGSTDVLDYAIYGHIAALGHSPYLMTPAQYRLLVHLRSGMPSNWQHDPSVYGPLATLEQLVAAHLAGASLALTACWLKLANAVAFLAVGFGADRLLRGDPAARRRALLLWTANPLLLWSLIVAGHVDLLAAAIGLAGLLILDRRQGRRDQPEPGSGQTLGGQMLAGRLPAGRPQLASLAAGACIGAAADIKADYLLFALAAAWTLRHRPAQLAAAAVGAAAVLLPSYAVAGSPALRALSGRAEDSSGGFEFYRVVFDTLGIKLIYVVPLALLLGVIVLVLALTRLPAGVQDRSAVRAALAFALAWLLVWPHQFAWYSVMIICVLIFYQASRVDWLALAWLTAISLADVPGVGTGTAHELGRALLTIQVDCTRKLAPLVMFAALVSMTILCLTGRISGPRGPAAAVPPA